MSTEIHPRLDTFENPRPGRSYEIRLEIPEFTCLCPKTGQPDFATIYVRYVPHALCVELKSLKLYFWSYREVGHLPRGRHQPDPGRSGGCPGSRGDYGRGGFSTFAAGSTPWSKRAITGQIRSDRGPLPASRFPRLPPPVRAP